MAGIIDFSTSCPWQLYTFALIHMIQGIFMFFTGFVCHYLFPTETQSCSNSELVMARMSSFSCIYVGIIFSVLTHHSKTSTGKITRLSNFALCGSISLLISTIFIGNNLYGGFERSWMHMCDMVAIFGVCLILASRIGQKDTPWAGRIAFNDGLGFNCKALVFLFLLATVANFFAMGHFLDPQIIFGNEEEITPLAYLLWNFTTVLVFEIFLALFFSVFYDDETGHKMIVIAVAVLSLAGYGFISSMEKYSLFGWVKYSVLVTFGLCALCIIFERLLRRDDRATYHVVV